MTPLQGMFSRAAREERPVRRANGELAVQGPVVDTMFRFPATETMMGDAGSERLLRVIKSFSPSQPTRDISQFAGRGEILSQVIAAIEEHRNHLVLFGGRGSGKTSLTLALLSVARQAGYHCAYLSCSRESTVESIFRSALADLSIRHDHQFDPRNEAADASLSFNSLVPSGNLTPQALADVLARIRGTRLLVALDEFDRNENPTLTRDVTEIMKALSDRDIPVQIVIVGVGEVVDNLVGEHASIARVLYVVRLGSMSDEQIRDVLRVASHFAEVQISPDVVETIVNIAHGRPHIARLAGLKAAKMALTRNSTRVDMQDFDAGCDELMGYLDTAGFGAARRLIGESSPDMPLFRAMLQCRRDPSDRFTADDLLEALPPSHAGKSRQEVERALNVIASSDFGLLEVSEGPIRLYHFVDPRAELCVSMICGRAATPPTAWTGSETGALDGLVR